MSEKQYDNPIFQPLTDVPMGRQIYELNEQCAAQHAQIATLKETLHYVALYLVDSRPWWRCRICYYGGKNRNFEHDETCPLHGYQSPTCNPVISEEGDPD